MDITTQYYLNIISSFPNKNHWKVRRAVKQINEQISGYRFTALKSWGYIREFCNREGNVLEKKLEMAIGKEKRKN